MEKNIFDQFDEDETGGFVIVPTEPEANPFDAFDADPDASPPKDVQTSPAPRMNETPGPALKPLEDIPGLSFGDDPVLADRLDQLDAVRRKDGMEELNKARDESFIAGIKSSITASRQTMAQNSLEVLKRIEAGEEIPPQDDPLGYRRMTLEQRKAMRISFEQIVIDPSRDAFAEAVFDPQQYVEIAKGAPPAAVHFYGSSLQGVAAGQSSPGYVQSERLRNRLATMDAVDRGERVTNLADTAAVFYQKSTSEERAGQRAALEQEIQDYTYTPPQERAAYKAGQEVIDYSQTILPAAPGYEDSWGRQVGGGLGSLFAGLPFGMVGRIPALAAFASAGSGEALARAVQYDAAERAAGRPGLTQDQITSAGILGVAPGSTDILPVEMLLGRLKIPLVFRGIRVRAPLARGIARIGGQAFVEGFQEGGQGFLQNLIAQEIYNPEQRLSEGVLPEAGLGAGVGGIAQTAKEAGRLILSRMAGRRARQAPFPGDRLDPLDLQPAGPAPTGEPAAEAPAETAKSIPRVARPVESAGVDVIQFIRAKGGLEPSGELSGLNAERYPGLVRQGGLNADKMREALVEAGYLEETGPDQPAITVPQDVYDLVAEQIGGERVFPIAERAGAESLGEQRQAYEFDRELASQEENFVLPELARIDEETGADVVTSAYARLSNDEKAELIERHVRVGEAVDDILEDIAVRSEDDPAVAAMVIGRAVRTGETQAIRAAVEQQAPELVAEFDEMVASLPEAAGLRPATVSEAVPAAPTISAAPMAIPDALPETLPGEGDVALTPEAEEKWPGVRAAVDKAAARILPDAVRVNLQDNIQIARLRKEDELLALGSLNYAAVARAGGVFTTRSDGEPMAYFPDKLINPSAREIRRLLSSIIRYGNRTPGGARVPLRWSADSDGNIHVGDGYHWTHGSLVQSSGARSIDVSGYVSRNGQFIQVTRNRISYTKISAIKEKLEELSNGAVLRLDDASDQMHDFLIKSEIDDQHFALRKVPLETEADISAIVEGEEGAASEPAEDRAAAGREGVETGAEQPAPGGAVGVSQGVPLDLGRESLGLAGAADLRIIRQESASLRSDGTIIVGRRSRKAEAIRDGGAAEGSQRLGAIEDFAIAGFEGRVTAEFLEDADLNDGNLARLSYRIFQLGQEQGDQAEVDKLTKQRERLQVRLDKSRFGSSAQSKIINQLVDIDERLDDIAPVAKMQAVQRSDGAWEIDYVSSRQPQQGIGTKLYDAVEADLGIRMSPSGVLTDAGLAFWQKRSPASVQWHVPTPTWKGFNFSPRKIMEEMDRVTTEVRRLEAGVGTARHIPADQREQTIAALRKERGQLRKLYMELPEEARARRAIDQMFALRAFHGSPHDFDRFDLSKIGTGEGAQVFGRGLYFAEHADVAKEYRDALSPFTLDGQPIEGDIMLGTFARAKLEGWLDRQEADYKARRAEILARPQATDAEARALLTTPEKMSASRQDTLADIDQQLAKIQRVRKAEIGRLGVLYEVEIDVTPEQLLDFDKPIKDQSPEVREALAKISWGDAHLNSSLTGAQIIPKTAEGAQQLREAGIHGIRYLDQGSRAAGDGTRNIVIFDDALVKITAKNGEPITQEERQDVIDQMFALAGVRAQTVDRNSLQTAERLETKGKTPEQIFELTGWLRGPDGLWRFEIDDSSAKIINLEKLTAKPTKGFLARMFGSRPPKLSGARVVNNVPLPELLNHPKLFSAYPFLRQMRVNLIYGKGLGPQGNLALRKQGNKTTYLPIQVVAEKKQDVLQVLLHELQHYIQNREGFALGSDISKGLSGAMVGKGKSAGKPPLYDPAQRAGQHLSYRRSILQRSHLEVLAESLLEQYELERSSDVRISASAHEEVQRLEQAIERLMRVKPDAYERSFGEYEARLIERRINLTPEERRKSFPLADMPSGLEFSRTQTRDFQDAFDELMRRALINKAIKARWAKRQKIGSGVSVVRDQENSAGYFFGDDPENMIVHAFFYQEVAGATIHLSDRFHALPYEKQRTAMDAIYRDIRSRNMRPTRDEWADTEGFKFWSRYDPAQVALDPRLYRSKLETAVKNHYGEDAKLVLHGDTDLETGEPYQDAEEPYDVYVKLPRKNAPEIQLVPEAVIGDIIPAIKSSFSEDARGIDSDLWVAVQIDQALRERGIEGDSGLANQPLAMRRMPPAREPEALAQTDPYKMVIFIAMRAVEAEARAKRVSAEQEGVRVLRHEAVEFFKEMELFTEKEWATLKSAAKRHGWVETKGVRAAYEAMYKGGMSEAALEDLLVKEAIAEQFSEYYLNRKQYKGVVAEVFRRIADFIRRLANFMRREGFQTHDRVFERIEEGEFRQRFNAAFPEMAARAAPRQGARPMRLIGGRIPDQLMRQPKPGIEMPTRNLASIINDFNRLLDVPVRQGRPDPGEIAKAARKGETLVGQYDTLTGVIRLAVPDEIDTLAHEGGHALENRFGKALDVIKAQFDTELTPLASPGPDTLSEGFSEWFRRYVTNPASAQRTAPGFQNAFEEFLRQNAPNMLAELQNIQAGYQAWIDAPSGGAVASDMVSSVPPGSVKAAMREFKEEGLANTMQAWTDSIYTTVFDDLHPIRMAVERLLDMAARNLDVARDQLGLKAVNDAYKLLRLARDAYAAGHMDLLYGVHAYQSTEPQGPSLRDAMAVAFGGFGKGQWNKRIETDFNAYLRSRRMVREWERFKRGEISAPPDKFSLADHQQSIRDFEAAYPGFKEGAHMVYAFLKNMLRKKRDAGLITQELYDELVQRDDYVPVMRDMSDRGRGVEGGAPSRKDKFFRIFRFRGSQRGVINPLESIGKDAYETAMIIARNDAVKALDALARAAGPDGGKFAERIPAHEMKATQVNLQEAIRSAARDAGIDAGDMQIMLQAVDDQLGDNAVAQIWRAGDISEKGEAIIYLWENGKRIPIRLADGRFGHDMLHAIAGINRESTGWLVNILSLPSTVLRTGVTASLDFIGANYIRDQVSAWILTRGFVPFYDGARGIYNDLTMSDVSRIYSRVGGIMGGANVAAAHESRIKREVLQLRRKGIRITLNPFTRDFWRMTEFSETGTRLAVFDRGFKRAKNDGLSDWESAIEAAFIARDYIDFGRRGSRMLAIRRLIPFFNAALQGLDRGIRGMRGKVDAQRALRDAISPYIKSRTGQPLSVIEKQNLRQSAQVWAYASILGLIGLGLSWLYKDDEEYEEISDYMKATHWLMRVNGEWVRIPKPFELAFVSNLMERTFD